MSLFSFFFPDKKTQLKKQLQAIAKKHCKVLDNGSFGVEMHIANKKEYISYIKKEVLNKHYGIIEGGLVDLITDLTQEAFKTPNVNRQQYSPMVRIYSVEGDITDWLICKYSNSLFFLIDFNPNNVSGLNSEILRKHINADFLYKFTLNTLYSLLPSVTSKEKLIEKCMTASPLQYFDSSVIDIAKKSREQNLPRLRAITKHYANADIELDFRQIFYYVAGYAGLQKKSGIKVIDICFMVDLINYWSERGLNVPGAYVHAFIRPSMLEALPPAAKCLLQKFCGFSFEEMTIGYKPIPVKPILLKKDNHE